MSAASGSPNGQASGPELTPQNYVRVTARQLWDELPALTLGCVLFSVSWIPAFLLALVGLWSTALVAGVMITAPGWGALLAYEGRVLEGRRATPWHMLRAWWALWTRSALLGAVTLIPALIAEWTVLAMAQSTPPPWVGVSLVLDVATLLILVMLNLYTFPLISVYGADLYTALRSALLLASRHIWNTLGLLSMGVLFGMAIAYINSGLMFVLPAVWGVFLINNCRMLVSQELQRSADGDQ